MMKNSFHFTLKVLSVLKIFQFLSLLFGCVERWLDQKDNFKIQGVTTWLTSNCSVYIDNISRSKDNQAMNFGQFREYNMRNIFLEKSYIKYG